MGGAPIVRWRLVRELIEGASGYVFKTVGDAFCAAFASASSAVTTAWEVRRAMSVEPCLPRRRSTSAWRCTPVVGRT